MDNVITFQPKKKKFNNRYLFNLEMYENTNGELEVIMDIGDDVEDSEVFEALVGAGMKFATDHNMTDINGDDFEFVIESEDDE